MRRGLGRFAVHALIFLALWALCYWFVDVTAGIRDWPAWLAGKLELADIPAAVVTDVRWIHLAASLVVALSVFWLRPVRGARGILAQYILLPPFLELPRRLPYSAAFELPWVARFVARKEELGQLMAFARHPGRLRIWCLAGISGQGKSRLAHEFCRRLRQENWHAGFRVAEPGEWWPAKNTLIVIDDALARRDDYLKMVRALREAPRRWYGGKLRVLFVDQVTSPIQNELGLEEWYACRHAKEPLTVGRLAPEHLGAIAQQLGAAEPERAAAQKVDSALDAILAATNPEPEVADGLRRRCAERLRQKAELLGLSPDCVRLIAWAALADGLRWEDLPGHKHCEEHALDYPGLLGGDAGGVPAARPESLGQAFALEVLRDCSEHLLKSELVMIWQIKPEPLARAILFLSLHSPEDDLVRRLDVRPDTLPGGASLTQATRHWAGARVAHGTALMDLPSATADERAANVRRAIACYEEALTVYRKDEYPAEYAGTQCNLGNAVRALPSATAQERAENVRRAVACYEEALGVYRKDEHPVQYATTRNNLGNSLLDLPSASVEERAANVRRAVACCEEALTIRRKDEYPVQYATTQNNLGNALTALPSATAEERAQNVRRAIACYEEVLTIRRKDEYRVQYATTQSNLGNALTALPSATAEEREENLRRAIKCYNEALTIRRKDEYPVEYASTQNNLGAALTELPCETAEERAENVRRAITCYEEALTVYRKGEYPVQYAMAQNNLGAALRNLPSATAEEPAQNVGRAVACYEEALTIRRKDEYPLDYAMTQSNLGLAVLDLPSATAEERAQNVRRAVACFEEALAIRRKDEYPVDYATTQNNLGLALVELPSATAQERAENVRRAIGCYEEALTVYRKDQYPAYYAQTAANLGLALAALDGPRALGYLQDAYALRQFLPQQGREIEGTIRRLEAEGRA